VLLGVRRCNWLSKGRRVELQNSVKIRSGEGVEIDVGHIEPCTWMGRVHFQVECSPPRFFSPRNFLDQAASNPLLAPLR
jgi:hypothetical protein